MKLEIVTHCHSPAEMGHYAEALLWQADSIDRSDLRMFDEVVHCIFASPRDRETMGAIESITNRSEKVRTIVINQELHELFHRAYGRNLRAKETEADVVWFADVDYFFGPKCLPTIGSNLDCDLGLVFPETVMQSIDHETGDIMVSQYQGRTKLIDPTNFATTCPPRAIGGIQIVGSRLLKRVGYCEGTKHVQPNEATDNWKFRSDVVFRDSCGGSSPVIIPDVYRIRHSQNGYERK